MSLGHESFCISTIIFGLLSVSFDTFCTKIVNYSGTGDDCGGEIRGYYGSTVVAADGRRNDNHCNAKWSRYQTGQERTDLYAFKLESAAESDDHGGSERGSFG